MLSISAASRVFTETVSQQLSEEPFCTINNLGPKIGEGSQKSIFHSQENTRDCICLIRPGTTGNIPPEDYAKHEQFATKKLYDLGLPVVSVHRLVKHNDLVGLQKTYIHNALDSEDLLNYKITLPDEISFNKSVLANCDTIIKILEAHTIYIEDLQFLIDVNGNVLINDPRDVSYMSPTRSIDKVKQLRGLALENLLDVDDDQIK